jgi:hypothetical protein
MKGRGVGPGGRLIMFELFFVHFESRKYWYIYIGMFIKEKVLCVANFYFMVVFF